ncbi:MAG TPA: GAF domain-containing protein [Candidatus Dormibacteraeota bacterium]|nr:GAF domain-containing protein [Candidatus Dormibacteraeota bacterium]
MSDTDQRNATGITVSDSKVLAARSAALVSRGLARLSGSDMARVIAAAKALVSCLNAFDFLKVLKEKMSELFPSQEWSLLLTDTEKRELYFKIAASKELFSEIQGTEADALNRLPVKPGQGIAGSVMEKGEAIVISDVEADSRFVASIDGCLPVEVRSVVAVPLKSDGTCVGVIELINCVEPAGYSSSDLSLLTTLADFVAIAIRNYERHAQIHALTITDNITGLYNALHLDFMLDTEIYRFQRYQFEFSLVALELEHLYPPRSASERFLYRDTIDSYNHLSTVVADYVRSACRLIDLGFRTADGRFIVLLPQRSVEESHSLASTLHALVFNALRGGFPELAVCVGVVTCPNDGKTKAELLLSLDEALRVAKNTKRGGVAVARLGVLPWLDGLKDR